ncbi:MAG: RluA family pseudouridine synthase [Bacteroidaceae bacterium]|nr:RluA family pseudouridine synthase [Bacteroidaceae bacterium]
MKQPNRRNNRRPNKEKSYRVNEDCLLMDFLIATLSDKSRTTIKSYLSHRQVAVNNIPTSQFNTPLHCGDNVTINFTMGYKVFKHRRLRIIFEDEYIIAIDKGYGLLSMATQNEKTETAYRIVSDYVKSSDPEGHIFIVHRLDRDTSGVMIFAKRQRIQEILQRNWNEAVIERRYMAVVEGEISPAEGEVKSYLKENAAMQMYSTNDEKNGQLAITQYRTVKSNGRFSLVEVQLQTGRKNQIRVHMHDLGHPIIGDRKYGSTCNPIGRVGLHAASLRFKHPITGQMLHFESIIPEKFNYITQNK